MLLYYKFFKSSDKDESVLKVHILFIISDLSHKIIPVKKLTYAVRLTNRIALLRTKRSGFDK